MWLLMLKKNWDEMDLQTSDGRRARVKGYMLPIEGGGRIQAIAFMPLFDTFEHAEAASGSSGAPIYEVDQMPPPGADASEFEPFTPEDGGDPQWI